MTRATATVPLAATALTFACCTAEGPTLLDGVDAAGGTGIAYSDPLKDDTYRWPHAEIPYKFAYDEWADPQAARDLVMASMARWQDLTRVHFVEVPGCSDCLQISGGSTRCEAEIGVESGELRWMHLPDEGHEAHGNSCLNSGAVMHELGHVIGLRHEQQRSDRDLYVTVLWENVEADPNNNFGKDDSGSATEAVGDYDFSSIMHYDAFNHSSNARMTLRRNDSWGLFGNPDAQRPSKRIWRTGVYDSVTSLLVGDFDEDGYDDVVRHVAGAWEMSSAAQRDWIVLQAPDAPTDQVRAGRIDLGTPTAPDRHPALFRADGAQWSFWTPALDSSWHVLRSDSTSWSLMRLVDFDNDGDSDMVRILSSRFQVALDGRNAFQNQPNVLDRPMTLDDVIFGRFVGSTSIDAVRRTSGGAGLEISDGLNGGFTTFRTDVTDPIANFRAIVRGTNSVDDIITIEHDPDPTKDHYAVAPDGSGAFSAILDVSGVEDFDRIVIGNFDRYAIGQEMLVNGYFEPHDDTPTHGDRGGVAHIYGPVVVLSRSGRMHWEYWSDATITSNLTQYKIGDFDGDGKDDLFLALTNFFGVTSTQYHRMDPDDAHAFVGWRTLNSNVGVSSSNLAFGNFINDAGEAHPRMDVFRKNGNNWEIQSGGTGSWMLMMVDSTSTPLSAMRFADLDGDGITDILKADGTSWKVSWGGKTQFQFLNGLGTSASALCTADFDGDGKDDVVTSFSGYWWKSSGGTSTYQVMRADATNICSYKFGRFDGDAKFDVFKVSGTSWLISSGGTGNWSWQVGSQSLASSAIPAASLAIGRFSGGVKEDVIGYLPALGDDNLNGW